MSKSYKDAVSDKNNLLIVDGLNLAFRYKHANKKNFAEEYVKTVQSFAQSYKAKKIIVLSDAGSTYRYNIYSDYKKSRKDLRAQQSQEEQEAFQLFLEDWDAAFLLCTTIGETLKYSGVEADDIAAFLVIDKEIRNKFDHIWLLSTDRDWDLLVDDKVSRFSYRTRKEITIDNWEEHYPYSREDHLSVKVLQGDKSDDIPGVQGIGEKRAATLIRQYGSAMDIYYNLPIQDKKIYIQNLNNFGDQIITNYELMDLETFCWDALDGHVQDLESKIEEITTI